MSSLLGPYHFPDFNPIAFHVFGFGVHWYAFAYIIGLLAGRYYCMKIAKSLAEITPQMVDDFLLWCALGVIIGGRLGQVLFYYPEWYFTHPLHIFKVWEGGMSFHGGFIGVAIASFFYARYYKISLLTFWDLIAPAAPIGLGLGRFANFINQELWGRVTTMPWGVIYPMAGPLPRHPSEIYEALTEGLLLFLVLYFFMRKRYIRYPGFLSGVFSIGYALSRSFCEIFREPEILQSILPFGTTWGQWLSLPLFIIGCFLVWYSLKHRNDDILKG